MAQNKVFRMVGPAGVVMETTAKDVNKAWSNMRARLHYDHGLSWYDAGQYDHSDLKEVSS